MDERDKPRVQAEDNSIAIGEINISGSVTGNISIGHTIIQAADAQLRHDLGILLRNVQTTWIKGVLERSVHEAALLDLGMEIREEAVDNPWRMVMESPDQTREILPPGKRIKDIFYEANGLLLILGEPGSGKTTTLLQLARDLIAEVDQAFTQPVPVILNLSTWTNKEQPLNEWLVAELNSKYRLPKKDGQKWLQGRRILPLLDGLDEVKAENRAACVEKINQLVKDYGLQGLVVCSRIKDYMALDVRLGFYRAIYMQPLTPQQVDKYLRDAGDKLASLHATSQADEALKGMAQSPLILNIMSLAYQNTSAEALSDAALNTNEARRHHLFETYIARMFKRKAGERPYDDEQTKQRLAWLARNMQWHNQEILLIEDVQPSWLSALHWQWLYVFASRLISGLIFGLSVWLIFALMFESVVRELPVGLDVFLGLGLIFGLIFALPLGLIDVLRFERFHKRRGLRKSPTFWGAVINGVVIGLIVWLIFALPVAVIAVGLNYGLSAGLVGGLLEGLPFGSAGLIFGIRGSQRSLTNDIQAVDALQWFWGKALKGGLMGGIFFIVLFGLLYIPSVWPAIEQLYYGPGARPRIALRLILGFAGMLIFMGQTFAPIGIVIGAMLNGGLSREIIETKTIPNQGMRLSVRNAVLGGIMIWLVAALAFSPIAVSAVPEELSMKPIWLIVTLGVGLIFGLLGALWYGGLDVVEHYTLRLILVIQGHTPANYARFLDYAVDRILLHKVGGGYRFIHRLLLEHFADMGETRKKI